MELLISAIPETIVGRVNPIFLESNKKAIFDRVKTFYNTVSKLEVDLEDRKHEADMNRLAKLKQVLLSVLCPQYLVICHQKANHLNATCLSILMLHLVKWR